MNDSHPALTFPSSRRQSGPRSTISHGLRFGFENTDQMDMWRVLAVVEQMSHSLTSATEYLAQALRAIDAEMSSLQRRLAADADALRQAVDDAHLSEKDAAALLSALERVEVTATSVAAFAHRAYMDPPTAEAPKLPDPPVPK